MLQVQKTLNKHPWLLFLVFWFALLLLLPWRGFYLLNDSYVYEWSVKHFFDRGFLLHPLVSPTFLFQALAGAAIYSVLPTPTALRLLTMSFGVFTSIYFFKLLVLNGLSNKSSFFATLLLIFNPLFIYLSFSFMTDIYFLAFFVFALYAFSIYFKKADISYLYLSSIFVSLLFFTRQTGLIVYLSLIFVLLIKKTPLKHIFIFSLLPFVSIISYQFFYPKPLAYTHQSLGLTFTMLSDVSFYKSIVERFIYTFYYVGLFVFPFSIYYFFYNLKTTFTRKTGYKFFVYFLTFFVIFSLISAYFWFYEKTVMFYLPNILSYAGFNPSSLNDGIKQSLFVDSPLKIRACVTALCIFSLSVFISYIAQNFKKLLVVFNKPAFLALIISVAGMFVLTLVFRDFFDRYLLIVVPLVLVVVASKAISKSKVMLVYGVALFVLGFVSVLYLHDYLNLHKKLWSVVLDSNNNQITLENTHSTYEFNNYFLLDKVSNTNDPKYLFERSWLRPKDSNSVLLSYTDTWIYCRLERVYYPSFISKDSRTKGYFHIMVKGSDPFDPSKCQDIISTYNK